MVRAPPPAAAGRCRVRSLGGADGPRARPRGGGRRRRAEAARAGTAPEALRDGAQPHPAQRDPVGRSARDLCRLSGQVAGGARATAGAARARAGADGPGLVHSRSAGAAAEPAEARGHTRVATRRGTDSRRAAGSRGFAACARPAGVRQGRGTTVGDSRRAPLPPPRGGHWVRLGSGGPRAAIRVR